jgi:hypothetical protein
MRLVTLDGLQDYRYFTELYTLAYQPDTEICVPKLFEDVRREEEFVSLIKLIAEEDCPA